MVDQNWIRREAKPSSGSSTRAAAHGKTREISDVITLLSNMMTNFNQIVVQDALINKFFFCFDLPIDSVNQSIYLPYTQQIGGNWVPSCSQTFSYP